MQRLLPAVLLSALGLAILAARIAMRGDLDFAFLAWNLALAWAPVALETACRRLTERGGHVAAGVAALAWWLFFPNAIYLVTDLVHIAHLHDGRRIDDVLMLATFAIAGASIASGSLERMRVLVARRAGASIAWPLAALVWLTTGVGVWLGRVRRWNSWDALVMPGEVLRDALDLVIAPQAHVAGWALTLAIAAMLGALHVGVARSPRPTER